MSWWTYVNGTVTVNPMGRTQAEKRYILETVLDHLPFVTGSERDMNVYIIQKNGYNSSSSHTEFGVYGGYLGWPKNNQSLDTQDEYILVVNGAFRDRMFEQTYREFQKWLCRLAKRVDVDDVLVEITGWEQSALIRNPRLSRKKCCETVYGQMFERPTWCYDDDEFHEPNWCEYLMWDRAKDYDYPMMLAYKYFNDKDNDEEVERRIRYRESEE